MKAFCEAAPVVEIGGNVPSPELDEGPQTEHAMKRVFFQHGTHRSISRKRGCELIILEFSKKVRIMISLSIQSLQRQSEVLALRAKRDHAVPGPSERHMES